MDDIRNDNKKPLFVKRIYSSRKGKGTLVGIPQKLSRELELENDSYVKMYYDKKNRLVLLSKLETD